MIFSRTNEAPWLISDEASYLDRLVSYLEVSVGCALTKEVKVRGAPDEMGTKTVDVVGETPTLALLSWLRK